MDYSEQKYRKWLCHQTQAIKEVKMIEIMANTIKNPVNRHKFIRNTKQDFDNKWISKYLENNKPILK